MEDVQWSRLSLCWSYLSRLRTATSQFPSSTRKRVSASWTWSDSNSHMTGISCMHISLHIFFLRGFSGNAWIAFAECQDLWLSCARSFTHVHADVKRKAYRISRERCPESAGVSCDARVTVLLYLFLKTNRVNASMSFLSLSSQQFFRKGRVTVIEAINSKTCVSIFW